MASVQLVGEVVEAGSFQPVFGQLFKLCMHLWEGIRCSIYVSAFLHVCSPVTVFIPPMMIEQWSILMNRWECIDLWVLSNNRCSTLPQQWWLNLSSFNRCYAYFINKVCRLVICIHLLCGQLHCQYLYPTLSALCLTALCRVIMHQNTKCDHKRFWRSWF